MIKIIKTLLTYHISYDYFKLRMYGNNEYYKLRNNISHPKIFDNIGETYTRDLRIFTDEMIDKIEISKFIDILSQDTDNIEAKISFYICRWCILDPNNCDKYIQYLLQYISKNFDMEFINVHNSYFDLLDRLYKKGVLKINYANVTVGNLSHMI